jgi:aerobic carbon-monoxide dehydrogenase medium subunit
MKPPPFEYAAPAGLDEAVALLSEAGDDAKVLAGGQSLLPLLALRLASPALLVDIGRVDGLDGVDVAPDGSLTLGALVRQRTLERDGGIGRRAPLLARAAPLIAHAAIRNRGTIGGSLAHADPAAELPMVALASDAVVIVRGRNGDRSVAAADFFTGYLATALEPDEVLVGIRFPPWPARTGCDVQEFSRRHGDFAVAAAAAAVQLDDDGDVVEARLALAGVDATPVRAAGAEKLLAGATPSASAWREAAELAASTLAPPTDLHGTAAYRRQLVRVLSERALAAAADRVGAA